MEKIKVKRRIWDIAFVWFCLGWLACEQKSLGRPISYMEVHDCEAPKFWGKMVEVVD